MVQRPEQTRCLGTKREIGGHTYQVVSRICSRLQTVRVSRTPAISMEMMVWIAKAHQTHVISRSLPHALATVINSEPGNFLVNLTCQNLMQAVPRMLPMCDVMRCMCGGRDKDLDVQCM